MGRPRKYNRETTCFLCKKDFIRYPGKPRGVRDFCSSDCRNKQMGIDNLSKRVNQKGGLTEDERNKISKSRKSQLSISKYEKEKDKHVHRIVMEQKLGRPLVRGEVVHHLDLDSRNNDPENLMLFSNQAEHLAWHLEHDPRYTKGAQSHV